MAWRTTNNPRRNFVTLRLTDDEAADLDWLQARLATRDRSATLRTSLSRVIRAERKKVAREKAGHE